MYPGNFNRRATSEYRFRFRGDLSFNNTTAAPNNFIRQPIVRVNPMAQDQHAYRQMTSHSPRPSMFHPVVQVPSTIQGNAVPNFHHNQPRPIYSIRQCPNMTPATTFPTPLPFSVASLVGVTAGSPTPYTISAPTHGQQQQQGAAVHPTIPTSTPVIIPPYNIYGYGGSMNQMQQLPVAFLPAQVPSAVRLNANPSAGNGNRRVTAAVQPNYMECSDISDSDDEDIPQDLRTKKNQSLLLMIDNRAPGSRVAAGAATSTMMPMQADQVNNHKKFQYKAWTSGTEPIPGCSSALMGGNFPRGCEMEGSSSSSRPIEELVDDLKLSPYITREEAVSRLQALGCKEDVQREIDAFAAIIRCGATNYVNHSSQAPRIAGNDGTVNRSFAMGSRSVPSYGIPRQSEDEKTENGQMQMPQRASVIRGIPKMN